MDHATTKLGELRKLKLGLNQIARNKPVRITRYDSFGITRDERRKKKEVPWIHVKAKSSC